MAKEAFKKKKKETLFTGTLDLNLREKRLVHFCTGRRALCGAKTLTHWKVFQKYLVSF